LRTTRASSSASKLIHFSMPFLTLVDPHGGVAGAPAYLEYFSNELYLDWCAVQGTEPVPYAEFRARTLREGKDWWARHECPDHGTTAPPAKNDARSTCSAVTHAPPSNTSKRS